MHTFRVAFIKSPTHFGLYPFKGDLGFRLSSALVVGCQLLKEFVGEVLSTVDVLVFTAKLLRPKVSRLLEMLILKDLKKLRACEMKANLPLAEPW